MEILLSLIEIQQFQQYTMNKMDDEETKQSLQNKIRFITFPDYVPLSEILEEKQINNDDEDIMKKCKFAAHKIYNKYIEIGSEYEINISHQQREPLTSILCNLQTLNNLNNINLNDLCLLFEESKNEMVLLLIFSMKRFMNHSNFKQIAKIINDNNNTLKV